MERINKVIKETIRLASIQDKPTRMLQVAVSCREKLFDRLNPGVTQEKSTPKPSKITPRKIRKIRNGKLGALIEGSFDNTLQFWAMKKFIYSDNDKLSDVSSISFSNIERIETSEDKIKELFEALKEDRLLITFNYCSYGNYDNSGWLEKSNYQTIKKDFSKEHVITLYGCYSDAIGFRVNDLLKNNELYNQVEDILRALANYPVLDEQLMSDLEWKGHQENWESYLCNDMKKEVKKMFEHHIEDTEESLSYDIQMVEESLDKLSKDEFWSLFNEIMEYKNVYFESECFDTIIYGQKALFDEHAIAFWYGLLNIESYVLDVTRPVKKQIANLTYLIDSHSKELDKINKNFKPDYVCNKQQLAYLLQKDFEVSQAINQLTELRLSIDTHAL